MTKIFPLKNIFIKKYFIFFPEYLIQEEIREGLQGWLDTKIPIHFSLKIPYQKKEKHLSTQLDFTCL